ncbi:MAG: helix-turn-helix domain-containing protein [Solirubrobacterales bacterium]
MAIAIRIEEVRSGLVARLRGRRAEIEEAILARVYSVSDAAQTADPEYADGLKAAVRAALGYGIEAIESSEDRAPPIPTALLAQARLAARAGVRLETVLRRYLAGYTLLGDFVIEESEKGGALNGTSLKRLLRVQAELFDCVIAAISEEYRRERENRLRSPEQRLAERVKRMLAGEPVDTVGLTYEFEAWHVGAIGLGPRVGEGLRELADRLDRRLLLVQVEGETVWGWFGGRRRISTEEFASHAAVALPAGTSIALGEPVQGQIGWRLTHRQAKAVLPIAHRTTETVLLYAEVGLLASILRDDLLFDSLRRRYLDPFQRDRDGGVLARETLRAYLAADRNVSSAAAMLSVDRNTVARRIRAIEERIGCPLNSCATELDVILRLDELDDPDAIDAYAADR